MTTLADIENAELQLAKLRTHAAVMRDAVAELCAFQEKTDKAITLLNLQVINARLEFERSK